MRDIGSIGNAGVSPASTILWRGCAIIATQRTRARHTTFSVDAGGIFSPRRNLHRVFMAGPDHYRLLQDARAALDAELIALEGQVP